MRILIQRVSEAKVEVLKEEIAKISNGLLVFLGVAATDMESDIDYFVDKITNLRIFEDAPHHFFREKSDGGKMNKSLIDIKGEILVVSQFTLYADCKKGRRPSFTDAAPPEFAEKMYKLFVQKCKITGLKVGEGKFGAMMDVSLTNDGPVTIWMDSKE